MMPVDHLSALLASALQDNVAENGNIEVERYAVSATRTAGRGFDDGFSLRKAMDEDVKKTAQGSSQGSKQDDHNRCQIMYSQSGTFQLVPGLDGSPHGVALLVFHLELKALGGMIIQCEARNKAAAVVVIDLESRTGTAKIDQAEVHLQVQLGIEAVFEMIGVAGQIVSAIRGRTGLKAHGM